MDRLIPPFAAKKYMMINGIAELPCINVSQGYCQVVDWNVEQIRYFHALGWSSLLNVPAIHLKNLQPPRCRVKSEQSRPANSVHVRRSMVNGSHQIFFISDGVSKVDLFQGCRKRSISGSIFWEIFNHIWETWVSQLDGWPIQGWYSSFSHRLVYKPIYSRYTQIYRDLSKPKSNLSIITRWDRQMFIYIYNNWIAVIRRSIQSRHSYKPTSPPFGGPFPVVTNTEALAESRAAGVSAQVGNGFLRVCGWFTNGWFIGIICKKW